jgi:hypothetical protein
LLGMGAIVETRSENAFGPMEIPTGRVLGGNILSLTGATLNCLL